jgi:hypothetical protein
MNDRRDIQLLMSSEDILQIAESVGSWDKMWTAIGYMATWNTTYPTVKIMRDGGSNMVAIYYRHNDDREYVIGAVWHEDHYGFHS